MKLSSMLVNQIMNIQSPRSTNFFQPSLQVQVSYYTWLGIINIALVVTPSERWSSRPNPNPGLIRTLEKGWGIIGSVRFLEGYYLLVVTKARLAVTIGHHVIYKVEDVSMIYLPSSGAPVSADEQKYQKLFLVSNLIYVFIDV